MQVKINSFHPDDAAILAELINNPKVLNNLRDLIPDPYHKTDAEEFIAMSLQAKDLHWAIRFDEKLVGGIGMTFYSHEPGIGEIGFWLGEPYWGQGITTQAVANLTNLAYNEYALKELKAYVFPHNKASMRVLEKNNFVLKQIIHKGELKKGKLIDTHLFTRAINE